MQNLIEKVKETIIKFGNIISGKDKNWDGKVDIKDHMIEAEEKAKNESKSA
tara:strand:- start:670 stop:822 length:153 start_codon:yes stop_codon:yes gene_type:complete